MKNRMYIRNVFGGKSLLDTSTDDLSFTLEEKNENWVFSIPLSDAQIAKNILENKDDLNIFVVNEASNEKVWFYSQNGLVDYDENKKLLTIKADHKKEYLTK